MMDDATIPTHSGQRLVLKCQIRRIRGKRRVRNELPRSEGRRGVSMGGVNACHDQSGNSEVSWLTDARPHPPSERDAVIKPGDAEITLSSLETLYTPAKAADQRPTCCRRRSVGIKERVLAWRAVNEEQWEMVRSGYRVLIPIAPRNPRFERQQLCLTRRVLHAEHLCLADRSQDAYLAEHSLALPATDRANRGSQRAYALTGLGLPRPPSRACGGGDDLATSKKIVTQSPNLRSGARGARQLGVPRVHSAPRADGPPGRSVPILLLLGRSARACTRSRRARGEPSKVLARPCTAGS